MEREELLALLKNLSLNSYESKCYMAFLQFKNLKASECAKIANVPPTKVHVTLRSLAERGLINFTNDKPMMFFLVPPENGLMKFVDMKKDRLENLKKQLKDFLGQIKFGDDRTETREKVVIKYGREQQHGLALNFPKTAEKEIMIISAGEKLPYSLLQESKKAIDRGVKIRYIVTKLKENEDLVKRLKGLGYDVRLNRLGQLFMSIKDSRESFLVIKNPNNLEDRITVLILDENLSRAHAQYFNEVWRKSEAV